MSPALPDVAGDGKVIVIVLAADALGPVLREQNRHRIDIGILCTVYSINVFEEPHECAAPFSATAIKESEENDLIH
jgi:hypothetical protein